MYQFAFGQVVAKGACVIGRGVACGIVVIE